MASQLEVQMTPGSQLALKRGVGGRGEQSYPVEPGTTSGSISEWTSGQLAGVPENSVGVCGSQHLALKPVFVYERIHNNYNIPVFVIFQAKTDTDKFYSYH